MAKKLKLSPEEKEAIDMIAASIGKESKDVQEVFLGLLNYITLQTYQGNKEFIVPYLLKANVKVKKVVVPKAFKLEEVWTVESNPSFHNIMSKIELGEKTWIEEFISSNLFNQLGEKLGDDEEV